MILKIYLLCSLCAMVSSVPVPQTIPSQTYPIYQQNDYRISPLNTANDFNPCYLQNTAQNAQPILYQKYDYGTSTNDLNSYLLQNTAQNSSPLDLKQILLNKILNRPSLQAILDPSAWNFGLNELATPSVVNNYIILPMEYPNVTKTDIYEDISLNKVVETETAKISNKKDAKKKAKRKPRNEQDKAKVEKDKDTPKSDDKDLTTKENQPNKKTEKKSDRTSSKDGKKKKQRQNEIAKVKDSVIDNNNKTEFNTTTQKPRRHRKKAGIDVNSTLANDQNINAELITNITISKDTNTDNTTKTATKEPDLVNNELNTTKNDVTNDFLKTFPSIPEDMAKSFMTGMNQFNNPQVMSFFSNYEQFYQSFFNRTQDTNYNIKRRRKSRKNKRNRRRNQRNKARNENNAANVIPPSNENNIIRITPNNSVTLDSKSDSVRFKVRVNPVKVTSGKKPGNIETLPNTKIEKTDFNAIPEDPKFNETPPNVEHIASLDNEDHFDELDATENVDNDEFDTPSMYYGLIDDYYPLFTDNTAYANEMRVKSLDSDRLFYISDYRENSDTEYFKRDINSGEIDAESKEEYITGDELEFRPPPHLETPDFITRKVERSEIEPNRFDNIDLNNRVYVSDYNDKYSSYSNAKSKNAHKSTSKLNNDVETVYARSKVVKYGQMENSKEDVRIQDDWDNFHDGETTYVIAKSLDPGQFW